MNEELKPCPFCGSEDIGTDYDEERVETNYLYGHFVECHDCFGASGYRLTKELAIRCWNRRT